MKKESNICNLSTAILFWSIIVIFGLGIFLLPQNDFSKIEGRMLSRFPEYSAGSLVDGSFFDSIGDFYSDRLPLREYFANLYALCEISLGKQEVNGAILCSDGALVLRPSDTSEKIFTQNIYSLSRLCESSHTTVFFAVPEQSAVYRESMPLKAFDTIQGANNACCDEFLSRISLNPTDYYYTTDHHWTTDGAYIAYTIICQRLGITPYDKDFFDIEIASSEFYGSTYRRALLPRSLITPDTISLYRYSGERELILTDHASGQTHAGLYDYDEIESGDAYRIFLGGNSAHMSIRDTSAKAKPKLLILKDSYANSLVPLLALHYDIDMIDPRYAESSQIKDLCRSQEFDAVLVLLCQSTLKTEGSVSYAADIIAEYTKTVLTDLYLPRPFDL